MSRLVLAAAVVTILPLPAQAQSRSGGAPPSASSSMAAAPASAGPAASAMAGGTTGLRGLRPVASPQVISLEAAFARAVQQSWDLRIAAAKLDEAQANVRKAWSVVLPSISLGGQYSFNFPEQKFSLGNSDQLKQQALLFNSIADITQQSASLNPDPTAQRAAFERAEALRNAARDIERTEITEAVIQPAHVLDGQLQLQVPLFSGRAMPLLQNAYSGVEITRIASRQARAAVVYGVARSYYQAVAAKKIAEIARGQLASAMSHRDLTRERLAAGALTELAVRRAELDVARAEQQVNAAAGGARMARAALGSVLGVVDDFDVAEPPPVPAVEENESVEALLARALAARDDIRLQKEALTMADRGRTDAWMRLLPTVALTAAGRGTTNVQGLVSQPFTGTVGVVASVPIFDGGMTAGAIDEAQAKVRQELLKVQQLEALVEQELRGTLDDLELKKAATVTADRVAELARATRENTEKLFEAGVATSLDVTDASLGAFSAEVEAARARFELQTARLGLAYALGELRPADDLTPMPLSDEESDHARRLLETAAPR